MQIKLNQFFLRDLHFEQVLKPQDGETDFNFSFMVLFYNSSERTFFLTFDIDLKNPSDFYCKLSYNFVFETTENITREFIESHFPIVNAPAIAFPFIRAFIGNFILNAGFQPAILPSINFTKLNNGKVFVDGVQLESPSQSK